MIVAIALFCFVILNVFKFFSSAQVYVQATEMQ